MQIEMKRIAVRDLVNGYEDKGDEGVVGYGDKLDIRPPYQREFVYDPDQQVKVIDSILRGLPLGEMHWSVRDDESYEIIDGQQRTISIARYVTRKFSVGDLYFHNLMPEEKDQINSYELTVYLCRGTDRERLDWFKTVNIAGKPLTAQEIRNASYAGPWVADARRYFSKTGCVAYKIGNKYLKGTAIRQDYLEAAIKWKSGGNIEDYMAKHQRDGDAKPLWEYFQSLIFWVKSTFTIYRKQMKGVDWGVLYNKYKDADLDPVAIEEEISRLIAYEDEIRLAGIYPYILTRDERHLNLRAFPEGIKQRVYEKQSHKCDMCSKTCEIARMEAHHKTPWFEGGKTDEENCQMLCKECHKNLL